MSEINIQLIDGQPLKIPEGQIFLAMHMKVGDRSYLITTDGDKMPEVIQYDSAGGFRIVTDDGVLWLGSGDPQDN